MTEGLIRIEHAIEREAVRDEALWIEATGVHCLHQHRRADCIDKPRSDADIVIPQRFKMKVRFYAMHPHVGDGAARGDQRLAQLEGRGTPTASTAQSTPAPSVSFITSVTVTGSV